MIFRSKRNLFLFFVIVLLFLLLLYSDFLLKQNLQRTNTQLALCFNNQASLISVSTSSYPNSEFKLTSQLFDGQNITVKDWNYKGDDIKEYSVTILEKSLTYPIYVQMWNFYNVKPENWAYFDDYKQAVNINNMDTASDFFNFSNFASSDGTKWQEGYGEFRYSKQVDSIHRILLAI